MNNQCLNTGLCHLKYNSTRDKYHAKSKIIDYKFAQFSKKQ